MFVSGNMQKKSLSGRKPYAPGQLLPVLEAEALLLSSRHQGLMRQVSDLSRTDEEAFTALYRPVFHQFAEFVQVLPMQNDTPLSGLLNVSIARAQAAVKSYLTDFETEFDPLIFYAIFTAALLQDVAKVVINQKVILCSDDGEYIDDWLPFSGSMVGRGEYFKLYPIAPIYQRLEDALTPALSRQLLPEAGFLWIASDLQVYADWIDALCGRDGQGGRVSRALAKLRREDIYNTSKTIEPVYIDEQFGMATEYGDAFYAWLKAGIADGSIAINTADAGVHTVADGVFLERNKIFHQFAKMMELPVSINVVFTQFGNLFGIANKGGGDFMNAQYFSETAGANVNSGIAFSSPLGSRQSTLRNGMVLSDPSMVFMNAQIPATTDLLKSMQPKQPASHSVPAAKTTSFAAGPKNQKQ